MRYTEKENSYKGNCSQKTWLMIIARNYCYNRIKSCCFNNQRLDEQMEKASVDTNLELKLTLEEALLRLTDEQRELIFLADYAGYKYLEISELTNQTVENVKIKIFRARQRLKLLCNER